MIQQRASGEKKWYSPERDIAYMWQNMVRIAADNLAEARWEDWFKDYFLQSGLTEDEIGQAFAVYINALTSFADPEVVSVQQALTKAGWFNVKPAAQVAILMRLGQVATASFFKAIRDVTVEGEEPHLDKKMILAAAQRALEDMEYARSWAPRWLRRFYRWLRPRRGALPGSAATT